MTTYLLGFVHRETRALERVGFYTSDHVTHDLRFVLVTIQAFPHETPDGAKDRVVRAVAEQPEEWGWLKGLV